MTVKVYHFDFLLKFAFHYSSMRQGFLLFLLIILSLPSVSQDSLEIDESDTAAFNRNEFGISIISPLLVLTGADDPVERYTNLTYRRRFTRQQAFKIFAGLSLFNSSMYERSDRVVSSVPGKTVHTVAEKIIPYNYQVGIGYEYIMGSGRVRHAVGVDAIYNNLFVQDKMQYRINSVGKSPSGDTVMTITMADTGRVNRSFTYHKIGANIHYTIRFEYSKHWLLTSSFIVAFRRYRSPFGGDVTDLTMNGIISDISIYYRF
jgi:hypothetical protein